MAMITPSYNKSSAGCVLNRTATLYSELIVSFISLAINSFLILCFIIGRSKLKSNLVSRYGCNVLVAAFVSSIARTVDTVDRFTGVPERFNTDAVDSLFPELQYSWWLLSKLGLIYLYLVLFGSIALFTLALRYNLLGVSGTVAGVGSQELLDTEALPAGCGGNLLRTCCYKKTRQANVLIFINWLLPFIVLLTSNLISGTTHRCIKSYTCPFDYFPNELAVKNRTLGAGCAVAFAPLSHQTLYVSTCLWFFTLLVSLLALVSCLCYYKTISSEIISARLGHQLTLPGQIAIDAHTETLNSQISRKQSESLLLVKMKSDLITILIISVVYSFGSLMAGLMDLIDSLHDWKFYYEEHYYTILVLNFPVIAETFAPVYLCINIYPINAALHLAVGRIVKYVTCSCRLG